MIKHKEKNKYSLNSESYGIDKKTWRTIQDDIRDNELTSEVVAKKYDFLRLVTDDGIIECEDTKRKRVWFLYDILLQEKYNHLYKREKLVNPQVGDFVYCDYEGFGRGTIVEMFSGGLMHVKFNSRTLPTMCNLDGTVFDEIKRRLTRL